MVSQEKLTSERVSFLFGESVIGHVLENHYEVGALLASASNGQLNFCHDLLIPERRLVVKISADLDKIGHEVKLIRNVAQKTR